MSAQLSVFLRFYTLLAAKSLTKKSQTLNSRKLCRVMHILGAEIRLLPAGICNSIHGERRLAGKRDHEDAPEILLRQNEGWR